VGLQFVVEKVELLVGFGDGNPNSAAGPASGCAAVHDQTVLFSIVVGEGPNLVWGFGVTKEGTFENVDPTLRHVVAECDLAESVVAKLLDEVSKVDQEVFDGLTTKGEKVFVVALLVEVGGEDVVVIEQSQSGLS
jgi:hypothetical protein